MSWSAQGTVNDGQLDLPLTPYLQDEAVVEQYNEAFRAVWNLVYSGALGDPSGEYKVSVSGHANPGHVPTAGWSNDSITISIYQVGELKQ